MKKILLLGALVAVACEPKSAQPSAKPPGAADVGRKKPGPVSSDSKTEPLAKEEGTKALARVEGYVVRAMQYDA